MPGLGAAVEAGGRSHCNLVDSASLEGASCLVNQKAVALKTKTTEPAKDH